jgi:hypothetical protein
MKGKGIRKPAYGRTPGKVIRLKLPEKVTEGLEPYQYLQRALHYATIKVIQHLGKDKLPQIETVKAYLTMTAAAAAAAKVPLDELTRALETHYLREEEAIKKLLQPPGEVVELKQPEEDGDE